MSKALPGRRHSKSGGAHVGQSAVGAGVSVGAREGDTVGGPGDGDSVVGFDVGGVSVGASDVGSPVAVGAGVGQGQSDDMPPKRKLRPPLKPVSSSRKQSSQGIVSATSKDDRGAWKTNMTARLFWSTGKNSWKASLAAHCAQSAQETVPRSLGSVGLSHSKPGSVDLKTVLAPGPPSQATLCSTMSSDVPSGTT